MDHDNHFKEFQDLCISILAQSDNCEQSQTEFRAARSIPEIVTAWQHFWSGVLHEVPTQVLNAFATLYDEYRDEINKAGVYYNEYPSSNDHPAMILIGGHRHSGSSRLTIRGSHKVYVLSNMPVTIYDHCKVHVTDPHADVVCRDSVACFAEDGYIKVFDNATFNGHAQRVECHDRSKVYISGGMVDDQGHLLIVGYNDSHIVGSTFRKIELHDHATHSLRIKTIIV